jgi:hypothetical protein
MLCKTGVLACQMPLMASVNSLKQGGWEGERKEKGNGWEGEGKGTRAGAEAGIRPGPRGRGMGGGRGQGKGQGKGQQLSKQTRAFWHNKLYIL